MTRKPNTPKVLVEIKVRWETYLVTATHLELMVVEKEFNRRNDVLNSDQNWQDHYKVTDLKVVHRTPKGALTFKQFKELGIL
jgi:hypothetical protein